MAYRVFINAFWWLMLLLWAWPASSATQQQQTGTVPQDSATTEPPGQLILAQVVFRHGARTPLSDMYWPDTQWSHCDQSHPDSINISLYDASGRSPHPPVIPDADSTPVLPGGCRMGLLTNNGYDMAVDLGRRLRQRYVQQHKLLPQVYHPAVLQAETTASSRTVLTLRGVLSGLYPGTTEAVPVACRKPEQEIMIGSNTTCAALGALTNAFWEKQEATVANDPAMQQLMRQVASALGVSEDAAFSWGRLRDMLACMEADGKQLPSKAQQLLPVIDSIATRLKVQVSAPSAEACLASKADCTAAVQLTIGQLLSDIVSRMDSAAAATASDVMAHIDSAAAAAATQDAHPEPAQHQQQWWQKRWWRQQQQATPSSSSSSGQHHRRLLMNKAAADTPFAPLQQHLQLDDFASGHQEDSKTLREPPTTTRQGVGAPVQHPAAAAAAAAAGSAAGRAKLVLYSAHDTSLMPLLTALGQEQSHWPGFTSHLAFELWKHGSTYSVQVLYDGKPLKFKMQQALHSKPSSHGDSSSSSTKVALQGFKQDVLSEYVISRTAHDAACQLMSS